eukprot:COSAG02_NODE_5302_length_4458_cov_32.131682_3_plen_119_part_00
MSFSYCVFGQSRTSVPVQTLSGTWRGTNAKGDCWAPPRGKFAASSGLKSSELIASPAVVEVVASPAIVDMSGSFAESDVDSAISSSCAARNNAPGLLFMILASRICFVCMFDFFILYT